MRLPGRTPSLDVTPRVITLASAGFRYGWDSIGRWRSCVPYVALIGRNVDAGPGFARTEIAGRHTENALRVEAANRKSARGPPIEMRGGGDRLQISSVVTKGIANLRIASAIIEGFSNLQFVSAIINGFANLQITSAIIKGIANLQITSAIIKGIANLQISSARTPPAGR